ncbi:MAG: hypothetical protein ACRD8W_28540, partial [Nitrososphaeraceae archaeon]
VGDNVMIPFFGGSLSFLVNKVEPAVADDQAAIITQNTILLITAGSGYMPAKPVREGPPRNGATSSIKGIPTENIDLFSKLERLGDLNQKGILTEQEFVNIKSQILDRISQQVRDASITAESIKLPSEHSSEQVAPDQFLIYENPKYGIKLRFPKTCEGFELDTSPEEGLTEIIEFIWDGENNDKSIHARLIVSRSTVPYGSKSLDAYSLNRIFRLRKIYPSFKIIESESILLAGLKGHKIVCTYANDFHKILQVWAIRNNSAYILSYFAYPKDQYGKYLNDAEDMIKSFEISSWIENGEKNLPLVIELFRLRYEQLKPKSTFRHKENVEEGGSSFQ